MKARVFISCGQNKNSDEVRLADSISKVLGDLGFDPYIAVTESTLRGVKENIFQRLSESEYFLFVDFKREALPDGNHRGSLFSHQELAIASFLNKDVLPLREKGVHPRDGIISFIQANAVEFTNRESLPELVQNYVSRAWDPAWKNELRLSRRKDQFGPGYHENPQNREAPRATRYYHLEVKNLNKFKTAINCCAYLEKVCEGQPGREFATMGGVEFKWRGVVFPSVIIPPANVRELDAFWIHTDEPNLLVTGALTDSPPHRPYFNKAGDYWLTFAVHSQNFREERRTFHLKFDGVSPDGIIFEEIE